MANTEERKRDTDLTGPQVGNSNKVHHLPRGKLLGKYGAGEEKKDIEVLT